MLKNDDVKPLLKWLGGKRYLVHSIAGYYDQNKRLVDPFIGGMSIPLGLKPKSCLISDINPHLINLYRRLKEGLQWDASHGIDFTNTSKVYYENRTKFNDLCSNNQYYTVQGALLLYYLNRTCFNGLVRFNKKGLFNSAYGKYKKLTYTTDFTIYKNIMSGWEIECGDFSSLAIRPDDFIYADPPYDKVFTKFTPGEFNWVDQVRLASWLAVHPGPVIASNSFTNRITDLYESLGFKVYVASAPRRISCDGNRGNASEMLAFRNL